MLSCSSCGEELNASGLQITKAEFYPELLLGLLPPGAQRVFLATPK